MTNPEMTYSTNVAFVLVFSGEICIKLERKKAVEGEKEMKINLKCR